MFYVIHALIGIAIANHFNSPWLIFTLAIASHFILDMIPHWDGFWDDEPFHKTCNFKLKKIMIAEEGMDMSLSLIVILLYFSALKNPLIVWGVFASLLPDIMKIFYITPLRRNNFFIGYLKFHARIQTEVSWYWGILIQAVIASILILVI